jgi:hypothetical protein
MILYHVTGRWKRKSILRDGLIPRKYSHDFDHALRSPLAACVWLTTDPEMPDGHSSYRGLRITVDIPSNDEQLKHWPTYLREQALDEFKDSIDEVIASDPPQSFFYCYFGRVAATYIKADDELSGVSALILRLAKG